MDAKRLKELALAMAIVPRADAMEAAATHIARRYGGDEQKAPIWAEKLRHTYQQVQEIEYPELAAANGGVLPIDTSVPPAAIEWEYFVVDQQGFADWIDDDGQVMPSGSMTTSRVTGRMAEMGHTWDVNFFDLERAAYAGMPLETTKRNAAKRYHDAKTNWTWLFGDSGKDLKGLCNHPNITVTLAPQNQAASSRLWANKSDDEIIADVALLIDSIPVNTIRAYFAAKVFMPLTLVQECKKRRLGDGDGNLTLWDFIKALYSGDDTGQGRVEFAVLNECDASLRQEPVSGSDQSALSGDFMLAIPGAPKDDLCFIRARPFTQRPPQDMPGGFTVLNPTHSKIGGCKCRIPLAVHRLDFGTT